MISNNLISFLACRAGGLFGALTATTPPEPFFLVGYNTLFPNSDTAKGGSSLRVYQFASKKSEESSSDVSFNFLVNYYNI